MRYGIFILAIMSFFAKSALAQEQKGASFLLSFNSLHQAAPKFAESDFSSDEERRYTENAQGFEGRFGLLVPLDARWSGVGYFTFGFYRTGIDHEQVNFNGWSYFNPMRYNSMALGLRYRLKSFGLGAVHLQGAGHLMSYLSMDYGSFGSFFFGGSNTITEYSSYSIDLNPSRQRFLVPELGLILSGNLTKRVRYDLGVLGQYSKKNIAGASSVFLNYTEFTTKVAVLKKYHQSIIVKTGIAVDLR